MPAPDFFIPNRDPRSFYPLASYLPYLPTSVARAYIEQLTAPGDLVIAPFACAPTIARVAHELGRRAIAVEANPLWSWLARAMASLPGETEINAALAGLGDARKDDSSLRAHITQLYATTCVACNRITPADYFIHERGIGVAARHYTCAHCGVTRDDPATEDDLKRTTLHGARGLHYHLAFERIAPADGLHHERIRKMLDVYTPRNLYALMTITQKIDLLFHGTRERDVLLLLLLHLLDRGTSFYADASPDTRARLTAHKQFVEFNLWREIEFAARELAHAAPALDLSQSAKEANVFVGQGSARSLAHDLAPESAALIIGALPTRRVSVWALSYFWGAWVLGRTAAQSLVPFLDSGKDAMWERRWYFDSLVNSFAALARLARADARIVFAFNESWHEVIESLLLAASGARLDLESFLFQPRLGDFPRREFDDVRGEYRIVFTRTTQVAPIETQDARALQPAIRAAALDAAETTLARRGEPLAYSHLHHAAYARLVRKGLLAQAMSTKFKTPPGRVVHESVVAGLREGYAHDFDHYQSETQFLWMRHTKLDAPLVERVEEFIARSLTRPMMCDELSDLVYRAFPGDLTPEAGLIEVCASAYAEERDGVWHLRDEDANANAVRTHALEVLARLGERMGYTLISDLQAFDLAWMDRGEIAHAFVWRARAQFADLAQIHLAPACGYVVVPESQVELIRIKTARLPHLADTFHEAGWNFVRMSVAEKLLEREQLERGDVVLMAGLVPPVMETRAQLELL
jgi:hypothetical protein